MKVKYDMEEIQEYIVQHRAIMHHQIQSEMKIFILISLWYFPGTEVAFGNAHCNDVVYYLLLPFIRGAKKPRNFISLHPNSVT